MSPVAAIPPVWKVTHRKLCTGFAYRLSGDNADCLASLHGGVGRHILAVALCTDAVARVTAEHRTDRNLFYSRSDYFLSQSVGNEAVDGTITLPFLSLMSSATNLP